MYVYVLRLHMCRCMCVQMFAVDDVDWKSCWYESLFWHVDTLRLRPGPIAELQGSVLDPQGCYHGFYVFRNSWTQVGSFRSKPGPTDQLGTLCPPVGCFLFPCECSLCFSVCVGGSLLYSCGCPLSHCVSLLSFCGESLLSSCGGSLPHNKGSP